MKPSHHTKQKRTEYVPLSGQALALLQSMQSDADPEVPFLFPGEVPGKPLTELKKFWRSVQREADLEGIPAARQPAYPRFAPGIERAEP